MNISQLWNSSLLPVLRNISHDPCHVIRHACDHVVGSFAREAAGMRPWQVAQSAHMHANDTAHAIAESFGNDAQLLDRLNPVFEDIPPFDGQFDQTLAIVKAALPATQECPRLKEFARRTGVPDVVLRKAVWNARSSPGELQTKVAHALVTLMRARHDWGMDIDFRHVVTEDDRLGPSIGMPGAALYRVNHDDETRFVPLRKEAGGQTYERVPSNIAQLKQWMTPQNKLWPSMHTGLATCGFALYEANVDGATRVFLGQTNRSGEPVAAFELQEDNKDAKLLTLVTGAGRRAAFQELVADGWTFKLGHSRHDAFDPDNKTVTFGTSVFASSNMNNINLILDAAQEVQRGVRRPNALQALDAKSQGQAYASKFPAGSTEVANFNLQLRFPESNEFIACRHLATQMLRVSRGHPKLQLAKFDTAEKILSHMPSNIDELALALLQSSPEVHVIENKQFFRRIADQFADRAGFTEMTQNGETVYVKRFAWHTHDHQMTIELKYKPADNKPYVVEVADPNVNFTKQNRATTLKEIGLWKPEQFTGGRYWNKSQANALSWDSAVEDMTACMSNRRLASMPSSLTREVLSLVIEEGFDASLQDILAQQSDKRSVLAIVSGNSKMARTPLYFMCVNGYSSMIDVVSAALERVQLAGQVLTPEEVMSVFDVRNPKTAQYSAIHAACEKGHESVIRSIGDTLTSLKNAGVDLRAEHVVRLFGSKDRSAVTPLSLACRLGHVDVIRTLFDVLADLKRAGIDVCADHVRQILDADAPDAGSSLSEALYGGQAAAMVEVFAGIRRLKEAGVDIGPMAMLQFLSSAWGSPTEFVNVLTAAPEEMIRIVAQCLDDLDLPKEDRKDYLIAQLGDTSVSGMPQLTQAAIDNYETLFGPAADASSANSFLEELRKR